MTRLTIPNWIRVFIKLPASDSHTMKQISFNSKLSYGLAYKYTMVFVDRGWVDSEKREKIKCYFLTAKGRRMHDLLSVIIEMAKPISTISRI